MSGTHRYSFHSVSLPEGTTVQLALPEGSTDPVVQAYAAGSSLNQYLVDWLLRFTDPGGRLLDLGCHIGTLSVPSAALGRSVFAVDASPMHVESIRLAAARNRLQDLRVEWCAIDRTEGEIEFDENGLWGMVSRSPQHRPGALRVPTQRADALVAAAGWEYVDLVKMDIEGSELAAIASLGSLLNGPKAPVLIYESNGMTFELFGYTIQDIRSELERLGYITCRVEGKRLIYCAPADLQPEAWMDLVALPPAWQSGGRTRIDTWTHEEMIGRCLEWGGNEHQNVREYLYRALESQCRFPRDDKRIGALRARLAREFGRKGSAPE